MPGAEKRAAGPAAAFLKQAGGWAYGALANHVRSSAGSDSRADVDQTLLQPVESILAYPGDDHAQTH